MGLTDLVTRARAAARTIAIATILAGLAGCGQVDDALRGYASGRSAALARYPASISDPRARGAIALAVDDFGGLDTDALRTVAVPWKLVAAALVLDDPAGGGVSVEHLRRRLRTFGFLFPREVGDWPATAGPPPAAQDTPLGLSVGMVGRNAPPIRVTAANLGCAACHAGVRYDGHGDPIPDAVWLGSPNTSLDLEAYTRATYHALKSGMGDQPRLLRAVDTLFPGIGVIEKATLRLVILPAARQRMAQIASTGDKPLPFGNGAPGLTNGVAALKLQFHLLDGEVARPEYGFTSIPDLGDRTWRSALLYDGAYAVHGQPRWRPMTGADRTPAHRDALAAIVTFFTVPSMGQSPDRARTRIPAARDVLSFLDSYRAPPFPGPIDPAAARRGAAVYASACAGCHGTYAETPQGPRLDAFPNWRGDVGTDRARTDAVDPAVSAKVKASAYRDIIDAAHTGVYAAPPLSGVWASAPYLHDGSVPTLAQLLGLQPRARRFMVGGHALDLTAVGIRGRVNAQGVYAYPDGYKPFSRPEVIDTAAPGLSNAGHERMQAGLSNAQKRDLIEYLKRL